MDLNNPQSKRSCLIPGQSLTSGVPYLGVSNEMVPSFPAHLRSELEQHVSARTGRRVRNLAIEFIPEAVILHGSASTYYVKQLAQQGVRDVLPQVRLENAIVVDGVN
jgi:hypothetical protein